MKQNPFYWRHEHSFVVSLSMAPFAAEGLQAGVQSPCMCAWIFFFQSLRWRGEKTNSHYRLTAKRDINRATSTTSRLHGTHAADAINSIYRARAPPFIRKLRRPLSGESSRVQGRGRCVGSPGGAAGACRCLMLFCCHFRFCWGTCPAGADRIPPDSTGNAAEALHTQLWSAGRVGTAAPPSGD